MGNHHYTGIGSRESPPEVIQTMVDFGRAAATAGVTLRSGAAPGADRAFEQGCDSVGGSKEIYLPWKAFQHHPSHLFVSSPEALEIASTLHPVWDRLKPSAKSLITRNVHQVLGNPVVTPSRLVVCWTSDGCESHEHYSIRTGGTGTAISLASLRGIPVFNLKNPGRLYDAIEFLTSLE